MSPRLSMDFLGVAETYGKVIIAELSIPDSEKSIKPINIGGVAGGCFGIVFGRFGRRVSFCRGGIRVDFCSSFILFGELIHNDLRVIRRLAELQEPDVQLGKSAGCCRCVSAHAIKCCSLLSEGWQVLLLSAVTHRSGCTKRPW